MSEKEILSYASITPAKDAKKVERMNPFTGIELPGGSRKKGKRVGRGRRSGMGKTSARGQKGQRSRSGYSMRAGFEGGQMPLHRRLPKRGFRNPFREEYQVVNLWRIEKVAEGQDLGPAEMLKLGLVSSESKLIKVLGTGELSKKLNITADAFSNSAKEGIEKAGGTVTLRTRTVAAESGKE